MSEPTKIAKLIMRDLDGRSGLLDGVDADVRAEIEAAVALILGKQIAALAPPAQTQQGLSEEEGIAAGIDDALAQRVARQTIEIHELKAALRTCRSELQTYERDDMGGRIQAVTEAIKDADSALNLEKQPSPAAAPAQLSELATAQRGLDEWCKAAMQERARADAAEAKLAALAGQPAPDTSRVLDEALAQGEKDREAMERQHDSQKLPGRIR